MAFGVSGVLTKPWENAREHGIFGFIQGLGTACLGFIVQPVSGILDFVSLAVHGVGASCKDFLRYLKTNQFQIGSVSHVQLGEMVCSRFIMKGQHVDRSFLVQVDLVVSAFFWNS